MNLRVSNNIDLFRGFLAQYVILAHIIPAIFPGILGVPGTLAVWCFFVVSGYLNYFSFKNSPSIKSYYLKRLKRLLPLLLLSFFIVSITQGTFFNNDIYTVFPIILDVKGHMPFNGVLWTIVIEMQLYLVTPLLVYLYDRVQLDIKILYAFLLVFITSLGATYIFSKLIFGHLDLDDRLAFSAAPLYVFGFILFRIKYIASRQSVYIFSAAAFAIFLLILLERNSLIETYIFHFGSLFTIGRIIPLLLTTVIIFSPVRIFRDFNFGRHLGKATYEIYLFHGLFAYLHTKYFHTISSNLLLLLSYWLMPTFFGLFLVRLVSRLKRYNQTVLH